MEAYMIIDGQWGSTGKGLLAGYLAVNRKPDTMVCNFGPNAGHTYEFDDGLRVMTQILPTGIASYHPATILIGPGAIVDPEILAKELETFRQFLTNKKIMIHERAAVVTNENRFAELQEMTRISSTCKGTGAAIVEKVRRRPDGIISGMKEFLPPSVRELIVNGDRYLGALQRAELLQIESAQGLELGINSGSSYPYCTSRDINVFSVLSDCGIPADIDLETYVTMRTFPIRVGHAYNSNGDKIGDSGPVYPDQKELSWGALGKAEEKTTVTGKVRRVFEWSHTNYRKMIRILNPDAVFLNFVNYLDDNPQWDHGRTGAFIMELEDVYRTEMEALNREAHSPIIQWIGTGPKHSQVLVRPEDGEVIVD